jgi:hypothetical protein
MIEPVFADAKFNRRADRFLRRGRAAVRAEWRLITATGNLLKLWRHTNAPGGGLTAARGHGSHVPAEARCTTNDARRQPLRNSLHGSTTRPGGAVAGTAFACAAPGGPLCAAGPPAADLGLAPGLSALLVLP